jgi:phosphoribosylglycinamide formyltransferase-1
LKDISINALICNHPGAQVIQRARNAEITTFEIEGVTGKKFGSKVERHQARLAFDNECVSISKTLDIHYIVLAGFDQILTKSFTDIFPYRILNIHPAYDLKLFGGRNMVGLKVHEAILAHKMNYSGCAVHFVTGVVDQGPVILKKRVRVLPNDTPEKLESRILEQEHLAYPEALQLLVDGRVSIPSSGNQCYVDRYSDNWDIEWSRRQEAYLDYVKKTR